MRNFSWFSSPGLRWAGIPGRASPGCSWAPGHHVPWIFAGVVGEHRAYSSLSGLQRQCGRRNEQHYGNSGFQVNYLNQHFFLELPPLHGPSPENISFPNALHFVKVGRSVGREKNPERARVQGKPGSLVGRPGYTCAFFLIYKTKIVN